jgi:hypothetical protein
MAPSAAKHYLSQVSFKGQTGVSAAYEYTAW